MIVDVPTPDVAANSSIVQPSKARAARDKAGVRPVEIPDVVGIKQPIA
jgi:hypothetical protein